MTPERLAEIKARAEAATPGPWKWAHERICPPKEYERDGRTATGIVETDDGYYPPWGADADFIAHARQDIPELVAEVERLRCAIDELDDAKDTVAHYSWCTEVIKAVRNWKPGEYGWRLKR